MSPFSIRYIKSTEVHCLKTLLHRDDFHLRLDPAPYFRSIKVELSSTQLRGFCPYTGLPKENSTSKEIKAGQERLMDLRHNPGLHVAIKIGEHTSNLHIIKFLEIMEDVVRELQLSGAKVTVTVSRRMRALKCKLQLTRLFELPKDWIAEMDADIETRI